MLYLFLFFHHFHAVIYRGDPMGPKAPAGLEKPESYHDFHEEHFFAATWSVHIFALVALAHVQSKGKLLLKKIRSRV